MKKLFMIVLASMALAACGNNTSQNEANRDNEGVENTTEPSVYPNESGTGTMSSDTTGTQTRNMNQGTTSDTTTLSR